MSPDEIQREKEEVREHVQQILDEVRRDAPKVFNVAAAAVGATLGGAASYTALFLAGTTGLSGAGIMTGLAATGTVVGGGAVAGVFVLAAPVVVLGVGGYALAKKLAKKRRNAKVTAVLTRAIEKLYAVQDRLMANAEHYRDELAEIKAWIDELKRRKP